MDTPSTDPMVRMNNQIQHVMIETAKKELNNDVSSLHPRKWLFTSIGLSVIIAIIIIIMLLIVQPPFVLQKNTSDILRAHVAILTVLFLGIGSGAFVYLISYFSRKTFLNEQAKKAEAVDASFKPAL